MKNKHYALANDTPCTEITATVNGKPLRAAAGTSLAEIAHGERPCGGHGKCGKCKVIATGALSAPTEAEKQLLTGAELARGVRLACMTYALGDCEINTPSHGKASILTAGATPQPLTCPSFTRYGFAIDVGTTTLAARLYDGTGRLLAEAAMQNPQSTFGADVITRIEAALGGKANALAEAIRNAIDSLLNMLADRASIHTEEIDSGVITGNTVMLSLLTGESVEPFSRAPFAADRLFGETLTAKSLGLTALQKSTPVYLPPCISAFVGADTVCAILATDLCKQNAAMLADVGTNGEMAVWHNGILSVCSTAAGPAFEGVGISMGMQGAVGAIDRVERSGDALLTHVIGNSEPKGICGSGLVDAVACMLDAELLDESGYLEEDPFALHPSVLLTQQDIRMLQLAKSAICAGLLTLLKGAELSASAVPVLFIAGGFGHYLNKKSAARIGLLPKALAEKATTVGNAALVGASMLLLNKDLRETAASLARSAHVADLATSPIFSELFMSCMMLDPAAEA